VSSSIAAILQVAMSVCLIETVTVHHSIHALKSTDRQDNSWRLQGVDYVAGMICQAWQGCEAIKNDGFSSKFRGGKSVLKSHTI
jgi:hypothetical protein